MRLMQGATFAVLAALLPLSALAGDGLSLRPGLSPDDPGSDAGPMAVTPLPTLAPDPITTATVQRSGVPAIDPYDPLGIRAGGFVLYPSATATIGYTSNAAGAAGGSNATFGIVAPELLLQSDWDRHSFSLDAKGAYQTYLSGGEPDVPSASIDANGTIDLATGWSTDVAAGYAWDRQSTSDASYPTGAVTPPGVHEFTGSLAVNGAFGRGTFTLEGSADHTFYEDGKDATGAVLDQGDRTNTVVGGRARVGYALGPVLTPFVEASAARRIYARTVDTGGLRRASLDLGGRVGVAIDSGPVLTGEASVGYTQADFDDPALATLSAISFDGKLTWAPTEIVTVTFDGATALNPSTDPASSGSVAYSGSIDVDYAWRQNVIFNGNGGFDTATYQGTGVVDTTYTAGLGATWKLNRFAYLMATYAHVWGTSTVAGAGYQSDTVKASLKVQQ